MNRQWAAEVELNPGIPGLSVFFVEVRPEASEEEIVNLVKEAFRTKYNVPKRLMQFIGIELEEVEPDEYDTDQLHVSEGSRL